MVRRQSPGSFVGGFVRYLRTRTDAPPDFHPHAALISLSVALGNRVWCDGWGSRPIYPNLWTVILAPSGFGKSVPLDMSEAMLHLAGLSDRPLPTSFSQEALVGAIAAAKQGGVFYVQEFSAFLAMLGRDYNAGAMQWLTELYDVPDRYQRILQKGPVTLERPFISILGASSPEWFADTFKANMLRGGFLARFLFCPSREPGPYVGYPGPRDDSVEIPLADHLRRVSQRSGKVDLSKVRRAFEEWDRSVRASNRKDCPPEFSGMRSRAGALVLKTAILFHVSEDPESLSVTENDLELAIAFVERSQAVAERYLTEEVAHDRDDAERLRLMEIVKRAGGRIGWSRALQNSHLAAFKFKSAVETLEQSDRLRVERQDGTRWLVEVRPLRAVEAA